MKKIFQYSIVFALGMTFLSGCKKFDEINTNPNQPGTVPPSVQLTASEIQVGFTFGGDVARFAGIFDQHIVGYDRQYAVLNSYNFVNSDFDQVWQNLYLVMGNLNDLANNSSKLGYKRYAGVSKVLLAYSIGMTSSFWNDVPFKEAFKGFDNLTPAFDAQQDVYANVQTLLDEAITLLADPAPGVKVPGADDVVYGGDDVKWTKFAYALKARFYLHTRKRDATAVGKASTALASAFSSSSDDAYVYFGSSDKSSGPWYQFQQQRPGYISFVSGTAASMLIAGDDPRLGTFIDTAQDNLGTFYAPAESGVQLMTYAEQKFIEAELAFVSGDNSTAATASNIGAQESVMAITGSAAPVGWITANASETGVSITLEKIINQKYLALYLNSEAYNDWRRTGYPTLTPNAGAVTVGGAIPRRFLPAETELERNSHTPTGVQLTDNVWWDN